MTRYRLRQQSFDPFTFQGDLVESSRIQRKFYKEGGDDLAKYTAKSKNLWKSLVDANDTFSKSNLAGKPNKQSAKDGAAFERAFGRNLGSIKRVVKAMGGTVTTTKKGNIMIKVGGKTTSLVNPRGTKWAGKKNMRPGGVTETYLMDRPTAHGGRKPATKKSRKAKATYDKARRTAKNAAKKKSSPRKRKK